EDTKEVDENIDIDKDEKNPCGLENTEIVEISKEEKCYKDCTRDNQNTNDGDLNTVIDNDSHVEEIEKIKSEHDSSQQETDHLNNPNDANSNNDDLNNENDAANENMSNIVNTEIEFVKPTMESQNENESESDKSSDEIEEKVEMDETDSAAADDDDDDDDEHSVASLTKHGKNLEDTSVIDVSDMQEINNRNQQVQLEYPCKTKQVPIQSNNVPMNDNESGAMERWEHTCEDFVNEVVNDNFKEETNVAGYMVNNTINELNEDTTVKLDDKEFENPRKSSVTHYGIEITTKNEHLLKIKDAFQTLPNDDKTKTLDNIRTWLEHAVDKSNETHGTHKEELESRETKTENEHLYKIKDAIQTLPNSDKMVTLDKIQAWLEQSVDDSNERDMECLSEEEEDGLNNDNSVPETKDGDGFVSWNRNRKSSTSSSDSNNPIKVESNEPKATECKTVSNFTKLPQEYGSTDEPTTRESENSSNHPHLLPQSSIEFTPWSNQLSSDESEYCDDFVEDIHEFEQENLSSDQNATPRNEHTVVDCVSRDSGEYRDENCTLPSSGLDHHSKISSLERNMVLLQKQLSDMRKENVELKRTILESRKSHCDYILQSQSDQCLCKLAQWDVFRTTFSNELNKDNQIWSVLEKEETTWETRMKDSRREAELVENEYNSHCRSLESRHDSLTGDELQFSLLTRSANQLMLQDTSMSRYTQLYQTALELNTSAELYQSAHDHQSDDSRRAMDLSFDVSSNEDPSETPRTICLDDTTPSDDTKPAFGSFDDPKTRLGSFDDSKLTFGSFEDIKTTLGSFDDPKTTLGFSFVKDNENTTKPKILDSATPSLHEFYDSFKQSFERKENVNSKDTTETVRSEVKSPEMISKKVVVGLSKELINDLELVANSVLQTSPVSQPSNTTQPMTSTVSQPIRKVLQPSSSSQPIAKSASQPMANKVLQSSNGSHDMDSNIPQSSIASQPTSASVSQSTGSTLNSTVSSVGPMISTSAVFTSPPSVISPPNYTNSWSPIVSSNNTWAPLVSTNNTWAPLVSTMNNWTPMAPNNSPFYVISPPPGIMPVRFNTPMTPVMMNTWPPGPTMYPFPMQGQPGPMMSQPRPMQGQPGGTINQAGPMPGQAGPMMSQAGSMPGQPGPMMSQAGLMPRQAGPTMSQAGPMPGQAAFNSTSNVQPRAQGPPSNDKQGMPSLMNLSGTTSNSYPPNSVQGSTNYPSNSYFGGPTLFSPRPSNTTSAVVHQSNEYPSPSEMQVRHVSGAPLYKTTPTEKGIVSEPSLEEKRTEIITSVSKQPSLNEKQTVEVEPSLETVETKPTLEEKTVEIEPLLEEKKTEVNLSQTGPSSQAKQSSLEFPNTKSSLEETYTEVDKSQTKPLSNENNITESDKSQRGPSLEEKETTKVDLSQSSDVKDKAQLNRSQADIDYLRSVLKMDTYPHDGPNDVNATKQIQDSPKSKLMKENSNINGVGSPGSNVKNVTSSEEVSKFLKELFEKNKNNPKTEETNTSSAIKEEKAQISDTNKETMSEQNTRKEHVTKNVKKDNTKSNVTSGLDEGQTKKSDKKDENKNSENLDVLNSKVDSISRFLKDLLEESNKTPKAANKKGNPAAARSVKKPEPGKKLRLSDILTDFSKLTDDPDEDNEPDYDDEDYPKLGSKKKVDNVTKNKMLNKTSRSRTVSMQSNDSATSDKADVTSKVKTGKPVQLVNTGVKPSTSTDSTSGWTEVVRKKLGTISTPGASTTPDQTWRETCCEKLKKHLVARFPNVSAEMMIAMVKNIRREHGNRLSGLSFDLIETKVRLQLAKKSSSDKTDSSIVGWEKFTGKAWADTKTPKSTEWNSAKSSQEECIICMYELGVRTTTLDCKHVFHTQCIKQWLSLDSVCPICKKYTTLNDDFPSLC
ncbi:hypothetical protein WDU94_011123, partial [Cyamophila willieti]